MKTYKLIITILFFSITINAFAGWQQKTSLQSNARVIPNIFVISEKAYLGGGFTAGNVYLNDFWEYNPATDTWTQKANQPQPVGGAAAFSLNSKGYIIAGWMNGVQTNGVYEYDPSTNAWAAKNNFSGAVRYGTCNFVIGTKGYVGLGYTPFQNDLWEYDPLSDSWTQKANFIGGPRSATVHFAINGLGYVGTGINDVFTYAGLSDFYTYNPVSNSWAQIGNFPGPARHSAVSFVINNKAYIGTGNVGNGPPGTTYNDFWEFDPALSSWTQVQSLPAGVRQAGGAFAIGSYGYVFDGFYQTNPQTFYNDLWQFCNAAPAAVITPAGATTFCTGGSILLNANTGTGFSYQWKRNNVNISGATNGGYTATTSGSYKVEVTNPCGSATSSATVVTVLQSHPNKPGTISGPSTFCAFQAGVVYSISPVANASAYNWLVPTGAIIANGQGTTSITVNFGNKNGNIKVAAGNACGFGAYRQLKVSKTCREEEEITAAENEIKVYPNPSAGDFIFEFSSEITEEVSLSVFDMTGKMVLSENISDQRFTIPGSRLSPGIYSAIFSYGENKKVLRLVKTQ